MRREGWQHGTARGVKTTTTTGPADDDAAKTPCVVAKPTGHSKFTGKCKRARCTACHSHPVSKSRDKAKGTHKLKSCDVALNHRLFSWRVAAAEDAAAAAAGRGARGWSKFSGLSATGILDQLSGRDYREEDEEEEEDDECRSMGESDDDDALAERGDAKEEDDDVDEEEFCRVGIVWEYVDGEDWCLVHEMT